MEQHSADEIFTRECQNNMDAKISAIGEMFSRRSNRL